MTKKLEMDFTKGKIFSKFLLFVLPIIGVNLLQAFYTSADMMIVGLSKNTNAVGSIRSRESPSPRAVSRTAGATPAT